MQLHTAEEKARTMHALSKQQGAKQIESTKVGINYSLKDQIPLHQQWISFIP